MGERIVRQVAQLQVVVKQSGGGHVKWPPAVLPRAPCRLARQRITRLRHLCAEIEAITAEITRLVASCEVALTGICGVAALTAAEILAEVGAVERFRTKAQFAMANGTAPLPASSGRTTRHRLNRGGNRQLNRALHQMATTLCRCDPETKAYVARRIADGKTRKEALRCLKRHLSNVVYRCLVAAPEHSQIAA